MIRRRKRTSKVLQTLNDIDNRLRQVEQWTRPKRGMSFWDCLPPPSVVKQAISALNVESNYSGFGHILSAYYNIPTLEFQVDSEAPFSHVPVGAIACYVPSLHKAYSKGKTMSKHTALHELFHALVAKDVVWVSKDKEQEYANRYADICLQMVKGEFTP